MMESLTIHSFSLENPSIQNVKTPYYKITAAQSKNKTPKTSHIYSHRLSLPMTEKKNIVQHNKTNQAKKNTSKQSINNRFNDTFIPQMLGEGYYGKVFKVDNLDKNANLDQCDCSGDDIDFSCRCSYIRNPYYSKFQVGIQFKFGIFEDELFKELLNPHPRQG